MKELRRANLQDISQERQDISELANELGISENTPVHDMNDGERILEERLNGQTTYEVGAINDGSRVTELKHIMTEREIARALQYSNPNYSKGRIWKTNTPQSIMTCELRRRGYDVTALPQMSGIEDINQAFHMWKDPQLIRLRSNGLEDTRARMSEWGDGARAQVVVTWKGTNIGHVFIAEQVNGETRFYDPQTGYKDVTGYFNHVKSGSVVLCRIDNLEPNGKINDYCQVRTPSDKQQSKTKLQPLSQQPIMPNSNQNKSSRDLNEAREQKQLREIQVALDGCNPNISTGRREWKENCQRCVPTYELRRRGFDVTVQPIPLARNDYLARNPFSVWQNPKVIRCRDNGLADIQKQMENWGDGARAQIVVVWKNGMSGHTFVAEQVNGKTMFYDPQDPKRDASSFFKNVKPGSVQMCRTDNLRINNELMRRCYV